MFNILSPQLRLPPPRTKPHFMSGQIPMATSGGAAHRPTMPTTGPTNGQGRVLNPDALVAKMYGDVTAEITAIDSESFDFKTQGFPLARVKKIMKLDPHVKFVSAESPVFFAKACELLVREMALRAYVEATDQKRRIVSRTDVANAIARNEMFDFLIDIVPRDSVKTVRLHHDVDEDESVGVLGDGGNVSGVGVGAGDGVVDGDGHGVSSSHANAVATSMFLGAPEVQLLMLQAAQAQLQRKQQQQQQQQHVVTSSGPTSTPTHPSTGTNV